MASAARIRNILMIHRRFFVVGGHHFVRASMAILASRRGRARLACDRVLAVCVSILRIRMTLRALDLLRRRLMRQALHILVAINA